MAVRLVPGRVVFLLAAVAVLLTQAGTGTVWAQQLPVSVSFDRDIRPILSDLCFPCHGPDESQRSSGLRLDERNGLFAERDGDSVVSPGNPAASLLVQRIVSADPDMQMPPPGFPRRLTDRQKQLLNDWIEQGAKWSEHWAFVRPQLQVPPVTSNPGWCRNSIDQFVLARLESAGLQPSPEADRRTLIRRVTLDLTGLPPKLDEVEAF
ncbi:MAG: c-type cytochrome domain-containing protein, partial [Planctomyces sp.]